MLQTPLYALPRGRLSPPNPAAVERNANGRRPPGRWPAENQGKAPGGISGAGAVAQNADGVELGLLAGLFLLALALLVAFVEQLDLLHLLEGLGQRQLGVFELDLQVVGRALQVFTPLHGRLGIGRIGKVAGVVDAGAVLLGLDLALEIAGHALEFGNHAFDLRYFPAPLVHLKLLQTNERLA